MASQSEDTTAGEPTITPVPRLPYDPEIAPVLKALAANTPRRATSDDIQYLRASAAVDLLGDQAACAGIDQREFVIPAATSVGDSDATTTLSALILSNPESAGLGPGILYFHGGGMVMGNPKLINFDLFEAAILDHDAVVISVGYRLAPEYPAPTPVEDCYAALMWLSENAANYGVDPRRLFVAGSSAGAGLAAGTALLARDRSGPRLAGQMLMCPMLDDRNDTVSAAQSQGNGVWDQETNAMAWDAYLGGGRGSDTVSIYAAPARAEDLSGLPPAFIDVGSVEVFRDEAQLYAAKLWAAGVQAELHVWAGGFHGFEHVAPHAAVSQASAAARLSWLHRMIDG